MAERHSDDTLTDRPSMNRLTGGLIWGIIFLGLGAAWTLDNLGLVDSDAIVRWWPMLLVVFGIAKITGLGARRSVFAGTCYLIAGGWLILYALDVVETGIAGLWPLALIVFGTRFVIYAMRAPAPRPEAKPSEGILDGRSVKVDVVMSSVKRKFGPGDFGGGEVNAVLGSVELEMRDASLAPGKTVLEANAVMAGIVLKVPRGWKVVSEVSCIMAEVDDRSEPSAESAASDRTLYLRGNAIMATIEIKN